MKAATFIALTAAAVAVAFLINSTTSSTLHVDELAQALGIRWWVLEVPEGVQKQALHVVFKSGDGTIERHLGSMGFKGGTLVKVYLFDQDRENVGYALTWPGGSSTGRTRNPLLPFKGPTDALPCGAHIRPGQIVQDTAMEGHDAVLGGTAVEKGTIAVTFDFGE